MNRILQLATVVAILASGAWMDRGNPGRSGTFPDNVSPKFYDTPRFARKLLPIEGNDQVTVDVSPAVANGTMVIVSKEGRIYALSTADLSMKWSNDLKVVGTSASFVASPAIDEGKIYVPYYWISPEPSSTSKPIAGICCYNLEDGKLDWRTGDSKSLIESTPLIDGNKIVYGSSDRHVYAIDKTSKGAPFEGWSPIELTGQVKAGVAKLDDGRYVVACQGQPHTDSEYTKNLYCLNPNDGSISWGPLQTKGSIDYTPATSGDYIFVTSYGYIIGSNTDATGTLYCFDRDRNPNEMWNFPFKGRMTGSPVTNGKYVVAADTAQEMRVFALDGDNFSLQAEYVTDNIVMNSPVIIDHYVYVGTRSGSLSIYDLDAKKVVGHDNETGIVQNLNVGGNEAYLMGSPIIWNDALFAVNNIGHVFKFEMKPNISVTFEKTEQTVKKGEQFRFRAVVKNEREQKLQKSVKISLRTDADWLSADTDTTVSILDAGQQAIIEFSGTAEKATYDHLIAKVIVSSDNPEITYEPVNLILFVTEKNLQVTYIGGSSTIWDDELLRTLMVTNTGNTQILFDVITDIGVNMVSSGRSILLNPDASVELKFEIDPKACGFDKPVELKFSFRSDGEDLANYILKCTLKRSMKIIKLAIGKAKATVDDTEINVDPPPFISKNITMVPLRFVSDGLGLKIEWVADIKTIIVDLGNESYLRLLINSSKAYVDMPDGSIKEVPLASPPQIVKGRTFVPLRIISEMFSCDVVWDAKTKGITITKRLKP